VSDAAAKSKTQLDREFSELYRTHLRDVYSYAYYRVGNHHDAEDLTEQTFLQAYRHFERAQRESRGRPLRPWLIRIAHNLAANLFRDRSRRPSSPLDDTAAVPAVHATEDLAEGREELSRVLGAVGKLPEDRRDALIMRFALDMDNREIARALDRSDGATKVLIHRAIKQLEALVAEAAAAGDGTPTSDRDGRDGATPPGIEAGAIASAEIPAVAERSAHAGFAAYDGDHSLRHRPPPVRDLRRSGR
jgi:RNA polymerase sigma-70 factor (ECF subfamily)